MFPSGILGIIVKSNPQAEKASGGATQKKTKILVPLKDLMETLQQKSFLVSPLGPNKKIIRFTGSDSVKGMLKKYYKNIKTSSGIPQRKIKSLSPFHKETSLSL